MAEGSEKTEQATERQIQKFREEGKVATSKELLAAVSLAVGVFAFYGALPWIGSGLLHVARDSFARAATRDFVVGDVATFAARLLVAVGPGVIGTIGPGVLAGLGIGLVITNFNVSSEAITPDFERLDPIGAAKSMFFSLSPWVNLAKALAVAALLSWSVYSAVAEHFRSLPVASWWPVGAQLTFLSVLAKGILTRALPMALAVGGADYAWQRYQLSEQMMMTREDVKQEHKDSEGDPQVRARRRQRARQLAMGRRIADVAKADVVVTNPTHYAVALRYRKEENASPVVVARGLDHMALRIRSEATRKDVPVIENRQLARALYAKAKVGAPIPAEFYGPVAQILALVYRRRKRR